MSYYGNYGYSMWILYQFHERSSTIPPTVIQIWDRQWQCVSHVNSITESNPPNNIEPQNRQSLEESGLAMSVRGRVYVCWGMLQWDRPSIKACTKVHWGVPSYMNCGQGTGKNSAAKWFTAKRPWTLVTEGNWDSTSWFNIWASGIRSCGCWYVQFISINWLTPWHRLE